MEKRKKQPNCMNIICWIIIPFAIISMLVLDGLGIYSFNTERLIVIGTCILVILIPFFSEISIKSISIKKENNNTANE